MEDFGTWNGVLNAVEPVETYTRIYFEVRSTLRSVNDERVELLPAAEGRTVRHQSDRTWGGWQRFVLHQPEQEQKKKSDGRWRLHARRKIHRNERNLQPMEMYAPVGFETYSNPTPLFLSPPREEVADWFEWLHFIGDTWNRTAENLEDTHFARYSWIKVDGARRGKT